MKTNNIHLNKTTCSLIGISVLSIASVTGFQNYNARLSTPNTETVIKIGDPCQIALTEHSGKSKVDQRVTRYQQLSQGKRTPEDYLERLGWAYIAKARTSYDPGYYTLAQQTALCLDLKRPNDLQAQLLLGHVLHNLHQFKNSEKIARDLTAERGAWMDYGLLGDTQMEQGKLTEAVDAYQNMIDQRPGPQAYFRIAHLRWIKGDLDGALYLMRMAAGSLHTNDKETAAWAFVKLAEYEHRARNINEAEHLISRALEFQPDYAPALLLRGQMLMSRKAFREAVDVLVTAVNINPLPLYQWAYREALQQAGDSLQAEKENQNILEKGALLDRRSFALYLTSTHQNPKLGLTLAQQELEARQDVFTFDAMAWALRANGFLDMAHRYSVLALSEGTEDGRLHYHAAVIANELGLQDEAHRHYTHATSLNHLLLPSERQDLESRFAAILPRTHDLAMLLYPAELHINQNRKIK